MDRGALVPDETIIDTLLKAMKGKKGVDLFVSRN